MVTGFSLSYDSHQTIKRHQLITRKSYNTPITIKTNKRIKLIGIHEQFVQKCKIWSVRINSLSIKYV